MNDTLEPVSFFHQTDEGEHKGCDFCQTNSFTRLVTCYQVGQCHHQINLILSLNYDTKAPIDLSL